LRDPTSARGARRFAFSGAAEIIAHRGYSARAPENTLAAIEAAIEAGADAVEFDLHATADGVPVLFHDETLERTTDGAGPVRDKTLGELRGRDAGSWFGAAFAGEPIPTLGEALARLRGRVGRVYPEVKGYGSVEDLARMAEAVREAGLVDATVFISMDWAALERMRARVDDLNVGYIVEKAPRAHDGIARAAGDPRALVDFDHTLLLEDPALAEEAMRRGVELAVWTVDDPADAGRLLDLGVPRITTNRVAALTAWKATL
jgi:glycerophosphoryl diester phosphodiesterase